MLSRRPATTARRSQAASRQRRTIMLGIGLVAAARLPRDRRFQQHVILFAIAAAAVTGLTREGSTDSFTRLTAWTERQYLRQVKGRVEALQAAK